MEEVLVKLGIILILAGFFAVLLGVLLAARSENVKFAFGGFIGPVPFGFANDPRMLALVIFISLFVLLFFVLSVKQI